MTTSESDSVPHRGSGTPASDEIPMLTEVLPTPARAVQTSTPADFDEASWNRIALKIEANVMQRMLRHADRLVDGPLVERLDELLERGAQRLVEDIRGTLREAVREAVARSIAEELGKARAEYKRHAGSS
ncbi:MAG: hypothetical protein R3E87_01945 [Burkholderiaceae bacterium]